jgi:hypothetical protein
MAAPPITAPIRGAWYLGFDCATKTFAFSVGRVDLRRFVQDRSAFTALCTQLKAVKELMGRARLCLVAGDGNGAKNILDRVGPIADSLDASTQFIEIADGGVVDLCPGVADKDIPTIDRVRAVINYVDTRIRPTLSRLIPTGQPLNVVVEFQMGPNAPARVISCALLTLFASDNVFLIGPSIKNKVAFSEEGKYCYFAARYSNNYGANKAQVKHNFAEAERIFGTQIPPTAAAIRGHIADSFMQIIGYELFEQGENSTKRY